MLIWFFSCTPSEKDSGGSVSIWSETELQHILYMSKPLSEIKDPTNRVMGLPEAEIFGEQLFFAKELSINGEISCASCHDPQMGFSDGLPQSIGIDTTTNSSPSLYAVGHQRWLNWVGSCDTAWCQAIGPLEKDGEMGSSRVGLVHTLNTQATLKNNYESLFGDLPESEHWPAHAKPEMPEWELLSPEDQHKATEVIVNIAKAIAAYEATILPPQAPIDLFFEHVRADPETATDFLSEQEEQGLRLFIGEGQCSLCHSGPLFTNLEFHNIGLPVPEWMDDTDMGRYDGIDLLKDNPFNAAQMWSDDPNGEKAQRIDRLNQKTEQLGQFKTPHLRELLKTAPYMHGGHFTSLVEVVDHYANPTNTPTFGHTEEIIQQQSWSDEEKNSLVSFLELLSSD
ncbi:MAG: hypothetical protein CMK59_12530 [Proteobacteria bacterium]|nr:hypothetical protein [Pseudomonadota bacterium]